MNQNKFLCVHNIQVKVVRKNLKLFAFVKPVDLERDLDGGTQWSVYYFTESLKSSAKYCGGFAAIVRPLINSSERAASFEPGWEA